MALRIFFKEVCICERHPASEVRGNADRGARRRFTPTGQQNPGGQGWGSVASVFSACVRPGSIPGTSQNFLNFKLPYDPVIPRLSLCSREVEMYIHTKMSTWMFMAAGILLDKK